MAGRSNTRPQRPGTTDSHVDEVVRILVHLQRGLIGREPGPSDLRRLARRFGATPAEIQAWSATDTGRRVMSTWSVDALEALRPGGRTGIYHLDAQILACELEADAQARRTKVSGRATRQAASRGGGNGKPVRGESGSPGRRQDGPPVQAEAQAREEEPERNSRRSEAGSTQAGPRRSAEDSRCPEDPWRAVTGKTTSGGR